MRTSIVARGCSVVAGLALAVRFMIEVLPLPVFGVAGFFVFGATALLSVVLVNTITRRIILPVWLNWSRARRFGVIGVSVLATAILCVLLSPETPMDSTWRWAVGPQVGRRAVPRTHVSWGQAVPSVFEFTVSSWPGTPDPEWSSRLTSDLPSRLGNVASRIDFRVTQPEGHVFNLNNGLQWEQFRGSDGVTVNVSAVSRGRSKPVGHLALNLHAVPVERRWNALRANVPASSESVSIDIDSGASHKGDLVYVSVDRVSVRVMDYWLDIGQVLSVCHALSLLWLALVVSVLTTAGVERMPGLNAQMSRWPGARVLGESPVISLLATLVVVVAAWVGTSQAAILLGWQRATWMRISIDAEDRSLPPPFVYVNHTGAVGAYEPVTWNGWLSGYTQIGIRPVSNTDGVRILAIEGEQNQVMPPASWRLPPSGMALQGVPQTLLVTKPGVLWVPNQPYSSRYTVVFEAGPGKGSVELEWLDQRRVFDLSSPAAVGYRADITRPAAYEGWFLLPPNAIGQISISFGNRDAKYAFRNLSIDDDLHQSWTGRTLAVTSAAGCRLVPTGDDVSVEREPGAGCAVRLPNLRPINAVPVSLRLFVWVLLTVTGLLALWGMSILSGLYRHWANRYEVVERPMAWLRRRTDAWGVGRVAAIVGVTAVAFQLIYFIVVPIGYINDTHGYYSLARDYLKMPSFYALGPNRIPGYPMFIASTIWLLGDQMEGIALLQHLALAALGPVTVWFLYPRTGPLCAALGGLLLGIGPTSSLLANTVSTESLFANLSYLAMICLIHYRARAAGACLAGLLAGLAMFIRPNGITIPMAMLTWLFLWWWCGPQRITAFRRLVSAGVAVSLGFLLMVTPWLLAEHGMTGQWELDHTSAFTLWFNSMTQGRSPASLAINRPVSIMFRDSGLSTQCNDGEGWRLHTDLALSRYIDWPYVHPGDSTFFTESVREGVRENPRRFLQFFSPTFKYGLLHILPPPGSPLCIVENANSEVHYSRFAYPLPVPDVVSDPKNMGPFLKQLSYRWHPPQSRLRSAVLGFTQWGMDAWGLVAALALASLAACVMFAPIRGLTLLWLYWMVSVTLLGVVGWPTDRYMYIFEPFVYLLATVTVYALFSAKVRRT